MRKKPIEDLEGVQQVLRDLMPELQERYGVKFLGVFGSYATGQQRKRSDVDILVEFTEGVPMSLIRFVTLELELGKSLGRKVDLVERSALAQKPAIGKRILEEMKPI